MQAIGTIVAVHESESGTQRRHVTVGRRGDGEGAAGQGQVGDRRRARERIGTGPDVVDARHDAVGPALGPGVTTHDSESAR